MTDPQPFIKLKTLSDLLDESKIYLFPFNRLKFDVREQLLELCNIVLGIYNASGHYVHTNLCATFQIWGIDPVKGREDIDFEQWTKEKAHV